MKKQNLSAVFERLTEFEAPKIIARVNDYDVRISRLNNEFVWHSHPETDELFWVHKGVLRMELRSGDVILKAGDMFVVPKGVEHRPVAEGECEVLLFEPSQTMNTGDAGGDRTTTAEDWTRD